MKLRTRTFSSEEKEEIRLQMIEAGLPLLKEKGMTHMSITKLTASVGIGKSTFYSFYDSKEAFVEDMLKHQRKKILEKLRTGLCGKEKYTKEESIKLIRGMITSANNVYQHFSQEDELALQSMHDKNGTPYLDLERERSVIDRICSMMEGVKKELDYAVIANMMKIIVFTSEQKKLLHESGYERTQEALVDALIQKIFE